MMHVADGLEVNGRRYTHITETAKHACLEANAERVPPIYLGLMW